jgi:hypothetical protein
VPRAGFATDLRGWQRGGAPRAERWLIAGEIALLEQARDGGMFDGAALQNDVGERTLSAANHTTHTLRRKTVIPFVQQGWQAIAVLSFRSLRSCPEDPGDRLGGNA